KPLSGYGVRYGSRLLYAFCAHFGLTRASVIGHDIGGAMAVKLAADHPDVVGRLVLVATPANEEQIDLPTPLWLATLPVVGPLFYTLGRYTRAVRRMWMRPFVLEAEDLTDEVIDDAGRSTPAAASKTLGVARREIARGRLVRQARMIRIPVLLVAGEEDQIVDPQAVGDWAGGLEQAEVVLLDGCGHMPMIERTAEFNAQILAFLTGDARYLDYVEKAHPGREEPGGEEGPETAERELPYPPYEDTSEDVTLDLSPHERALREERDEGFPNVVRREGGRFPPRSRTSEEEEDAEDRRRRRREPSEGDVIPEIPKDLFEWPAAWEEFRPRKENRRRPSAEGDEEGTEEPPDR
ncbi:MAG: alpha/beta hydrolase, partial [Actinomycetota bacterium]